jgi:hypothetical protein
MQSFTFSDGDDLVLFDDETGGILYGHEVLREIIRTKRSAHILHLHVPAEAYIALLRSYFTSVTEVRAYLSEVDRTNEINPGDDGKLLEAASNAIWIEKYHLDILLEAIDEGRDEGAGDEWKD